MKFILNENKTKFILTEAPIDELQFDTPEETLSDVTADTPAISDYKKAILDAEKAVNQELVEKIWDAFYTEFGKTIGVTADKLRDLGKAFRVECLTLGFTQNTNPFLAFLAQNSSLIPNMNSQSYGAVHNEYKGAGNYSGTIDKADLLGNGKAGKSNLIFNADLYKHPAEDVTEYLKLQNKVINYCDNADADINETFSKLFLNGNTLKPINEVTELASEMGINDSTAKKKIADNDKNFNELVNKIKTFSADEINIIKLLLINNCIKNENDKMELINKFNLATASFADVNIAKLMPLIFSIDSDSMDKTTVENILTGITKQ